MTNETLETIKKRRSCRAYKPEHSFFRFSFSCCPVEEGQAHIW